MTKLQNKLELPGLAHLYPPRNVLRFKWAFFQCVTSVHSPS